MTAVEAQILLPVLFGALLLVFLCLEQCGGLCGTSAMVV